MYKCNRYKDNGCIKCNGYKMIIKSDMKLKDTNQYNTNK